MAESNENVGKPAGWYDDPDLPPPAMRWWDGNEWTAGRHDPSLPPPPQPPKPVPAGPATSMDWIISVALLVFCWILGVIFLVSNPRFTRDQKIWIAVGTVGLVIVIALIAQSTGSSSSTR